MIDKETLEMLETSLRHLLEEEDDRPLMKRLVDVGWEDVVAEDPVACFGLLFELKGRTLSEDDALNTTLAETLADALGDSSLTEATLVLSASLTANGFAATETGSDWTLDGVALVEPAGSPIVFAIEGGLAVAKDASSLHTEPFQGFETALTLRTLRGALPTGEVAVYRTPEAGDAWSRVVARARTLLGAELLGIGRHVLGDVVDYTGARKQYGVAIASFQAIQHRMASAHAALVGAGHVVEQAATTGSAWEATVAKALAGRAAEEACTQAQQGYGAIGFTWEQDFHRYLKRAYTLDRLFGDFRTLEFEIGATLQGTRTVPRIGGF